MATTISSPAHARLPFHGAESRPKANAFIGVHQLLRVLKPKQYENPALLSPLEVITLARQASLVLELSSSPSQLNTVSRLPDELVDAILDADRMRGRWDPRTPLVIRDGRDALEKMASTFAESYCFVAQSVTFRCRDGGHGLDAVLPTMSRNLSYVQSQSRFLRLHIQNTNAN